MKLRHFKGIPFLLLVKFLLNIDGAGTNKQHVATKNTAKLDRETDELKHKVIPADVAKVIQQGRQAKGWSQKDLATVRIFVAKFLFFWYVIGND